MIVVDASAAVCGLLGSVTAREAMTEEQLHAPHLVDVEVAQTLRRLARGASLTDAQGWAALATFARLGLTRYPTTGLAPRVWQLRGNLSAYDASYVALAEALECPLLTADARLSRAPGLRCAVQVIPAA